ncbi:hypothetical protein SKAU_G00336390 [Synaphobranchus kaupii]|uniref:Uncharacterized protein n=1 Tax=Synaphobranchus kaupii TaxID=118154 RepID=A0A9Q1EM69_SYNKA|nr:hypothetical protein SKAU_G00336390 [Synaphobranchus kaupii]
MKVGASPPGGALQHGAQRSGQSAVVSRTPRPPARMEQGCGLCAHGNGQINTSLIRSPRRNTSAFTTSRDAHPKPEKKNKHARHAGIPAASSTHGAETAQLTPPTRGGEAHMCTDLALEPSPARRANAPIGPVPAFLIRVPVFWTWTHNRLSSVCRGQGSGVLTATNSSSHTAAGSVADRGHNYNSTDLHTAGEEGQTISGDMFVILRSIILPYM